MTEGEPLTNIRKDSEPYGIVPNGSEAFGNVPKDAEGFRTVPKISERTEQHTLTVREVARVFEDAGVARTERSITNWCQPNKLGVSRLDAYFDPNERKYYLTPESVERAIAEEKAKAPRTLPSESVGNVLKDTDHGSESSKGRAETKPDQVYELEQEIMDLKITNRVKDYQIDQLKQDRETFAAERQEYVTKLMSFSRKLGELETKLLQLESPSRSSSTVVADGERSF